MTEFSTTDDQNIFHPLGEAIAEFADKLDTYKQFLACKSAREALDELGVLGGLDDETEQAIEGVFGIMIKSGISLNLQGATEPEDIEIESQRLADELPPPIYRMLTHFLPIMIQRGIDFHRDQMMPQTDKVRTWNEEFRRFGSVETE